MIKVRALGGIGKRLGDDLFTFNEASIALTEVIRILYRLDGEEIDYSDVLSDVLVVVNGAAISGGIEESILKSGDEVALIPISHGG